MNVRKVSLLVAAVASAIAASHASATTFTWGRGAGPANFAWNNNPTGIENTGTTNWGGTGVGPFPHLSGDVANIQTQTSANQTLDLDQNITVGVIHAGRQDPGGPSGFITITGSAANPSAFTLTFDNGASSAILEHTTHQTVEADVFVSAPIAIAGNGTLVVSNDTNGQTLISGNVSSALSSGIQTLNNAASIDQAIISSVKITGAVSDGVAGGKLQITVTAPTSNLTLGAANSYSAGTSISAGNLNATADGALGAGNVTLTGTGVLNTSGGSTNNYINDLATLSLVTGTTDNLNYTGTDVVGALSVDGVLAAPGVYGAANFPGILAGTGTITVAGSPTPEPASLTVLGCGAAALLASRRRRTA